VKLVQSLKSLITEVASLNDIQKSIRDKSITIIYYEGDEPGGKGLRTIEPVCVGYSKAGNLVLRAWDEEGSSHTATTGEQPLPGWRLFRADKILSYRITPEKFTSARPGYNFDGDKSMTRVILNAKFDNQ
jgi:predicted DNA-binding transcriptional regulator YafY